MLLDITKIMSKKETKWLNTTIILKDWKKLSKPCHELGLCPYGQLVEAYPLHPEGRTKAERRIECKVFGHDCPAFYHTEQLAE